MSRAQRRCRCSGSCRRSCSGTLDGLKKAPNPAYFISYTLHDTRSTRLRASVGALQRSDQSQPAPHRSRCASATTRSTTRIRCAATSGGGPRITRVTLPLTDDRGADPPGALARRPIARYKQSAEALTRVKTNVAAKIKDENPAPDFSREEPQSTSKPRPAIRSIRREWEERLRRLSALFSEDPLIFRSDVSLSVEADQPLLHQQRRIPASPPASCSAGSSIQAPPRPTTAWSCRSTRATSRGRSTVCRPRRQLPADARAMIALLARLRDAPLVDPFSGPAILSGRAAGVFFHEIFGHRVEGHRQSNADDGQTFAKSVGHAVLPAFLSVVFDPTRRLRGNDRAPRPLSITTTRA